MTRARKLIAGALLLEVLMGMSLFLIALLLSFGVFPGSQRAGVQARNYTYANVMAKDFLERELVKDYAAIVSQGPFPQFRPVTVHGQTVNLEFEVEIVVDQLDAGPPFARSNVRSIVRWNEGPLQREVFYETWVTD